MEQSYEFYKLRYWRVSHPYPTDLDIVKSETGFRLKKSLRFKGYTLEDEVVVIPGSVCSFTGYVS